MPKALCIFFLLIGFLLGALGALILFAQYLEWQSFGTRIANMGLSNECRINRHREWNSYHRGILSPKIAHD
jgi:hypothetical protein